MIFNRDDYRLYETFNKLETRLEVLSFKDANRSTAIDALTVARLRYFGEDISDSKYSRMYELVGGGPQHIGLASTDEYVQKAYHGITDKDKKMVFESMWVIRWKDDDVMGRGKFATFAMLLVGELADMDRKCFKKLMADNSLEVQREPLKEHVLSELPLRKARPITTGPDYIQPTV